MLGKGFFCKHTPRWRFKGANFGTFLGGIWPKKERPRRITPANHATKIGFLPLISLKKTTTCGRLLLIFARKGHF